MSVGAAFALITNKQQDKNEPGVHQQHQKIDVVVYFPDTSPRILPSEYDYREAKDGKQRQVYGALGKNAFI